MEHYDAVLAIYYYLLVINSNEIALYVVIAALPEQLHEVQHLPRMSPFCQPSIKMCVRRLCIVQMALRYKQ